MLPVDFSKPCHLVYTHFTTTSPGGYAESRSAYHGCIWADSVEVAQAEAVERFGAGAVAKTEAEWRKALGMPEPKRHWMLDEDWKTD